MKFSFGVKKSLLIVIVLMVLIVANSIRMSPHHYSSVRIHNEVAEETYAQTKGREKEEIEEMEVYPTGSSIPDCSHACGPCFPCKRVMVSFKCSLAESCPIVYRCMCKGKYYHVPSN